MKDKEIQNIKPIAQLLEAHYHMGEVIETVIDRDVKEGLYKLKPGPRKEEVKRLAAEGLSNRQIAKQLGVGRGTVNRDMAGPSGPSSGPNGPPQSEPKMLEEHTDNRLTQEQVEELVQKVRIEVEEKVRITTESKVREEREKFTDYIYRLETNITDLSNENNILRSGKDIPNFRTRLSTMNSSVSSLIQSDSLVKMLIELESVKELLELDHDIEELKQLIHELNLLAERAKKWAERVTPTNDRWAYREQQQRG